MEPEQLIARVQELTGRLEDLDDPACRGAGRGADSGGRADVRRGAGANRRAGRRRDARRDGERRARRGPADDPRPVPGADRGARHGGARHGQALHGVARRQRRAARHRGRDSEAATGGQLQVVPGVVLDARAGGQAGARGGGARPPGWTSRGSSRRRPRLSGVPLPLVQVNGDARLAHARHRAPDAVAATDVDGVPLVVANVDGTLLAYRNSCADCGGRTRRRRARGGGAALPGLRAQLLPAAGRPLDGRRPPAAPAGPAPARAGGIRVAL